MNVRRNDRRGWDYKPSSIYLVGTMLLIAYAVPIREGMCSTVFLFIGIVPTLIFWTLDSYYLQQEKKFRGIYDDAISSKKIGEYKMPLEKYKHGKYSLLRCMWSVSEWPIYFTVIFGLVILGFVLA